MHLCDLPLKSFNTVLFPFQVFGRFLQLCARPEELHFKSFVRLLICDFNLVNLRLQLLRLLEYSAGRLLKAQKAQNTCLCLLEFGREISDLDFVGLGDFVLIVYLGHHTLHRFSDQSSHFAHFHKLVLRKTYLL